MKPHEGTRAASVATVTVSDTRTAADDRGGALLRERLAAAGHTLREHAIVPDDPSRIQAAVRDALAAGADAVVLTGGTGVSPRDQTYEAVSALLDKRLDGFGEAFRRLSWDEIGPRSMLSRALAGTLGDAAVFALPGSTNAVRLGVDQLVAPVLGHLVALLRGSP